MRLLKLFFLLAGLSLAGSVAAEAKLPPVKVYVPKVCLACIEWAEHLRQNGFVVTLDDTQDMTAVKKRYRIGADLEARHTAVVAGYFVEGHVPAGDILQLLKEKPQARGLAVPGSPRGAPGLDVLAGTGCETGCTMLDGDGASNIVRREMFNTYLVKRDGSTSVWERH
jgi:hypothetical protein